ncbi:MAG: dTDP-4-dehydrorhamnose reductase [Chlorobiaceae bacterium]|jgi:dTDP-4-dehydrorhamnose reductase|nr:dTDP-4-dehydrorhamnose reductase [Chlorobiaceae bacterium]NTV16639.1 dTDP-4-dehydrorhamnose reductase [Chlorobiaceae bacterium]
MNIIVTGSEGQLGSTFRAIASRHPHWSFFFFSHRDLDISDEDMVAARMRECKCDVVINCAAFTSVDRAEEDSFLSYRVNRDGAAVLARCANEQNVLLVHFSTYNVFNGASPIPYQETFEAIPHGVNAKAKLEGEELIRCTTGLSYIIIRAAWLYSRFGKNFMKTMLQLGHERESINVVSDRVGTPTYAEDLAEAVMTILAKADFKKKYAATYHYSNEGVCSWYDFALAIMQQAKLSCRVFPIESSEFPVEGPRPWYSVLNNNAIKKDWGLEIPHWHFSLVIAIEMMRNEGMIG